MRKPARFLSATSWNYHVFCAIRRTHNVNMLEIRRAIKYVQKNLQVAHPLVNQQMSTDGKDLFIEHYGKLLNISRAGRWR